MKLMKFLHAPQLVCLTKHIDGDDKCHACFVLYAELIVVVSFSWLAAANHNVPCSFSLSKILGNTLEKSKCSRSCCAL